MKIPDDIRDAISQMRCNHDSGPEMSLIEWVETLEYLRGVCSGCGDDCLSFCGWCSEG